MLKVLRSGEAPSGRGPETQFTGTVRRDGLVPSDAPSRVAAGTVTFEPGARTAWHTHPAGQMLIVTAGCGWVQCEGEPRQTIRPGDSVWIPANTRHWHGATSTTAMTHIAVTESVDGSPVTWKEHVTDAQYGAG